MSNRWDDGIGSGLFWGGTKVSLTGFGWVRLGWVGLVDEPIGGSCSESYRGKESKFKVQVLLW